MRRFDTIPAQTDRQTGNSTTRVMQGSAMHIYIHMLTPCRKFLLELLEFTENSCRFYGRVSDDDRSVNTIQKVEKFANNIRSLYAFMIVKYATLCVLCNFKITPMISGNKNKQVQVQTFVERRRRQKH